ncbi:HIT-like protein [Basidiobolus meristosporus CBS 931.73]|uniref:HIT-like protein n=1 Tax=Basidiobolus meristosporus CBS 931.73 TaxID=1314790 RepID=A0A1Y1XV31_9FUNG|nr:HIT-like protein [Basidiobolus meristosporus CBS 931.73]|eukprot:ORX89627.1 HIT-like protein [Basidiobolus meristosporus CBS 931.73]
MSQKLADDCIFCKIIRGEIPSCKVIETDLSYAFMDIQPLSEGHTLIIPKYHAQFAHEVPDEYLADMLPLAKKVALAIGAKNYNILQNNGSLAHQVVPHVHFHVIPKPNEAEGLGIRWPAKSPSIDEVKKSSEAIIQKL